MAGRPLERAVREQIEWAAANAGLSPLDYLLERRESGETWIDIAGWASGLVHKSITPAMVRRVAKKLDPNADKRLVEANKAAGDAHAELSLKVLQDASEDSQAAVSKAKALSDKHGWMAERLHREQWGQQPPATNVTVNLAELYVDALTRRPAQEIAVTHVPPPELPSTTDA